MSLPMRYGKPNTARRKNAKGLRDGCGGAGEPSGNLPVNLANFAGVSSLADAGGGWPLSFAIAALIHRINV